jgi:hypothetical protein
MLGKGSYFNYQLPAGGGPHPFCFNCSFAFLEHIFFVTLMISFSGSRRNNLTESLLDCCPDFRFFDGQLLAIAV